MHKQEKRFLDAITYPSLFVGLLWLVKAIEVLLGISFAGLGIYPRNMNTLEGILFAPLIHGNYAHLLSNSLPLLILGIIVMFFYRRVAWKVFFQVYFFTGICVWLVATEGYHIGASGLVYGFASFVFFSGIFRSEFRPMLLALVVAFVYGGLVWGVLPIIPGVSWESHLFGAITGAISAYYLRNVRT